MNHHDEDGQDYLSNTFEIVAVIMIGGFIGAVVGCVLAVITTCCVGA